MGIIQLIILAGMICSLGFVNGHSRGVDYHYAFAAYLPSGNKCGPQTLTGWTKTYDIYRKTGGAGKKYTPFFDESSGIFTAPRTGGETFTALYHCCGSARCKQGGVCDFTLTRESGTVAAAFGTRNTQNNEWSTYSTCTIERMTTGNTLKMILQSGGGTDCVEETGWRYAKFSCFLISEA